MVPGTRVLWAAAHKYSPEFCIIWLLYVKPPTSSCPFLFADVVNTAQHTKQKGQSYFTIIKVDGWNQTHFGHEKQHKYEIPKATLQILGEGGVGVG